VPYYCYVPRCYPCDPYDRPYYTSWGGPQQWNTLWSGHLTRYKSPPPAGYTPPAPNDWQSWKQGKPLPPGMIPATTVRRPDGSEVRVPIGANRPATPGERGTMRPGPASGAAGRSDGGYRPNPAGRPGGDGTRVPTRGGDARPSPVQRDGGSSEVRRPSEGRSAPSAPSAPSGNRPSEPRPSQPDRGSSKPAPAAKPDNDHPHGDKTKGEARSAWNGVPSDRGESGWRHPVRGGYQAAPERAVSRPSLVARASRSVSWNAPRGATSSRSEYRSSSSNAPSRSPSARNPGRRPRPSPRSPRPSRTSAAAATGARGAPVVDVRSQ